MQEMLLEHLQNFIVIYFLRIKILKKVLLLQVYKVMDFQWLLQNMVLKDLWNFQKKIYKKIKKFLKKIQIEL